MANAICPVCGVEFAPKRCQQYCSAKCRKRHELDKYIAQRKERVKTCAWCGKEFMSGKKYCSAICRKIANGRIRVDSPLNPNATKISRSIDEVDRYCKEHNITYGEYSRREQIAKMKGETL